MFVPAQQLMKHTLCFTTSVSGGTSVGAYESLNLGAHVGDKAQAVLKNRLILEEYIKQQLLDSSSQYQALKWLNQQHTTQVDLYENITDKPCDGIIARQALVPLAVMTADCMPIVIACHETGQTAAIHAGWRGLLDGIIEQALVNFNSPNSINVWIGPSISKNAFEVSDDVIGQFCAFNSHICEKKSENNEQKYLVDLPSIASQKLKAAGVKNINLSPVCTYQNNYCFSHRRATHQGIKQTGRLATVVMRLR